MVMQEQKTKTKQKTEQDSVTEEAPPQSKQDEQDKLKKEIDDLLDEIDDVLEKNAAQFVQEYIQKGGE